MPPEEDLAAEDALMGAPPTQTRSAPTQSSLMLFIQA